jgi:hypothetical protein
VYILQFVGLLIHFLYVPWSVNVQMDTSQMMLQGDAELYHPLFRVVNEMMNVVTPQLASMPYAEILVHAVRTLGVILLIIDLFALAYLVTMEILRWPVSSLAANLTVNVNKLMLVEKVNAPQFVALMTCPVEVMRIVLE